MAFPTYVQSLAPADNKPVATTVRDYGAADTASLAQQHVLLYDAGSVGGYPVGARIFSATNANPLAVAPVDLDGNRLTVYSVHVGNQIGVTQVTSPWIVQVASIMGGGLTVTGSVGATQLDAPWSFVGSTHVTGSLQATVQGSVSGTVVASVIGQPTVTASIAGNLPVTQVTSPWVVSPSSSGLVHFVSGSVQATQAGTWTFTGSAVVQGSVQATVAGSLQATVIGSVGASQLGAPWTVTGSTWVANTPSVIVANSVAVAAYQGTSAWIVQVASIEGPGLTITGSVQASQAGAWTFTGSAVVQGSVQATVAGSVQATIIGSVGATQLGSPWSFTGSAVVQGSVQATIAGSVQATVIGSVGATQLGTWTVTGSVTNTPGRAPLRFLKIAHQVSSCLSFPFDGLSPQVASSTAAGLFTLRVQPDVDSRAIHYGLLVQLVSSGEAMGVVRVVSGWTTGTSRSVTVTQAWDTNLVPASGQQYRFLLDTRNATQVIVKTELSSATNAIVIAPVLYDYAQTLGGVAQEAVATPDRPLNVANLARSFHVSQASYFLGVTQTVEPLGALGVKIDVNTITPGGAFALWAATT